LVNERCCLAAFGRACHPNVSTQAFFIAEAGQLCKLELQFSFFFDGTRNHKDEEKPNGSHSNVARLFEVCHEKDLHGQFRFYVQGVGTPCPQIRRRQSVAAGVGINQYKRR
jgi:hypothetical protein